jgi:hypothetical protein
MLGSKLLGAQVNQTDVLLGWLEKAAIGLRSDTEDHAVVG